MKPSRAPARTSPPSPSHRRKGLWNAAATLLAATLGAATAGGAGCVSILGDFGDGEQGATSTSGGTTATTGSGGGGGQTSASTGDGTGGGAVTGSGGGGAGPGTGGSVGPGTGGGPASCPSTGRGPDMVKVPGPNGADYCIDSTEVSVTQYNAWLVTSPGAQEQPASCNGWNADHAPATAGNYCEYYNYAQILANQPNYPILCVNWCDAYAFCAWAGKRLCGKIGGGSNNFGSPSDPTASQWYRACSEAGARDFPYGDQYKPMSCVGVEFDGDMNFDATKDHPHDVGTVSTCEGGYPGVFDMSGNAWEWEDSCNGSAGKDDTCQTRSGAFNDPEAQLTCFNAAGRTRQTCSVYVGFRCCADL